MQKILSISTPSVLWYNSRPVEDIVTIRSEPGDYRVMARIRDDGGFDVSGEGARPLTLTVRVEDVWERVPLASRREAYEVAVWRDGGTSPFAVLRDVAPDARIFISFEKTFRMAFT